MFAETDLQMWNKNNYLWSFQTLFFFTWKNITPTFLYVSSCLQSFTIYIYISLLGRVVSSLVEISQRKAEATGYIPAALPEWHIFRLWIFRSDLNLNGHCNQSSRNDDNYVFRNICVGPTWCIETEFSGSITFLSKTARVKVRLVFMSFTWIPNSPGR